ncbi:YhbY family RNA-binding protein [Candidatus Woesearchaeota archaeon]|nr:YhbY family RNA-binding protein [Candidatus Woesearchaeota archaeon]
MTKIPQNNLNATVEIGKSGLTKQVIEEIKNQLKKNKTVKVNLRSSAYEGGGAGRKDLAKEVVEETGAKNHKLVGKKLTLFYQ